MMLNIQERRKENLDLKTSQGIKSAVHIHNANVIRNGYCCGYYMDTILLSFDSLRPLLHFCSLDLELDLIREKFKIFLYLEENVSGQALAQALSGSYFVTLTM